MHKRNLKALLFAAGLLTSLAASAQSSEPFVYPKNGQTEQQQKTDEYDCHLWAVKQTGYNPLDAQKPAQAEVVVAPEEPHGEIVGGSLAGAAVGAFDGHAGQDALIGAVVGGLLRHRTERREQEEAQQETASINDQATAAEEKKHAAYHEADNTCLKAKGYEVG